MHRALNFSAGPAVLPLSVIEATKNAVLDFNGIGMSIMEISHRSKEFDAVIKEAQADVLNVMNLDSKDFIPLFLQGGASTQFAMIPMNFMQKKADYVNTGVWATKALKEAQFIAKTGGEQVNEIATSADSNFSYIPKNIAYNDDADYVHITTNNTIYGTEWRELPTTKAPLVVDMSSDIFAQQLDFSKASLIYAGAQKNIGPSGVTLVVINKAWAETAMQKAPTMLRYATHIKEESLFNTPPCLPIYVVGQTMKWIIAEGGLLAIEERNKQKAALVYDVIDAHTDFFKACTTAKEDRSLMNITFRLPSEELEEKFIKESKALDMSGLKGHRSAGGIRASVYNACPIEWVETLAKYMQAFYTANK